MNIDDPIIFSVLDTDFYKLTMGSVVFHQFPHAIVKYKFFNRGKTQFPERFSEHLQIQINSLAHLRMSLNEYMWLTTKTCLRPTYVDWLRNYNFHPNEVSITQDADGYLQIEILGPWYRTILWEVPLMAIICELYYRMTGQKMDTDWIDKIRNKAKALSNANCKWIDFGTRRRYSLEVQHAVVREMSEVKGFLGTSNPYLAFTYRVKPSGTYAHESVMAMSALYGAQVANGAWMKHWSDHFSGELGIALTDTFTTDVFLRVFDGYNARLFDGCRQDSGNPYEWGNKMLNHYKMLGINTLSKTFVFSDNLNVDKFIGLTEQFSPFVQVIGGIGTNFSNDVGVKPLNIVIKMARVDCGQGMIDVVKLSDDTGKYTGSNVAIDKVKAELGI